MTASKAARWTARILLALGILALVAVAAVYALSQRALGEGSELPAPRLATPTAAQLADAPRQLHVLGCLGCHGEGLKGSKFFDDPKLAVLWAPNLTRIAAKADDATLDRAIRRGVGVDGRALIIMPSEGYQYLTDQEAAALITAIRAYPASGKETPARSIGPIGRIGLVAGRFRTQPDLAAEFARRPLPDFGPATALGRHMTATKCVECHGINLKGQELEPGVVSADLSIAGAYDLAQFKTLMREGKAPSGKDIGLMGEVARGDFKHMTDEELASLHAYLVAHANR